MEEGKQVTLSGPMTAARIMGKAAFIHIDTPSGKKELFIRKDEVGDHNFKAMKDAKLGDTFNIGGVVFKNKFDKYQIRVELMVW